MLNGDGPPKYKPPPPKKTNSSTDRLNTSRDPVSEDRPLQNLYHTSQDAEPVTDLDAYYDDADDERNDSEHYHAGAPSGWDDPSHNEVPPPYAHLANEYQEPPASVNRGDSFVSPAMFV
ncbi:uncharacterized protein si:ch73-22o12.1 [Osmerus mordax]|uniref:uncharacterized protein si:ch73-22o12.1 n=1 Tax=Osmerus mordax TaxID=8014 RepID=UPI0035102932